MTGNSPVAPPLRGTPLAVPTVKPTEPADIDCVVLESCDQCNRRVMRPHAVNGRFYCAWCCPRCARRAASQPRALK